MQGIKDFIIHLPQAYNEHIETQSGVKIYADKRFSPERLSNREATIVSKPAIGTFDLEPGFKVLVDPTIVFEQHYKLTHGAQQSIFLVDAKKSLYKIDPSMIVCYRQDEGESWQGFQENGLYELVEAKKPETPALESSFLYIPPSVAGKEKNRAKLLYGNKELLEDVSVGQEVIVNSEMGIDYWINGINYKWFRNKDVIAVVQD